MITTMMIMVATIIVVNIFNKKSKKDRSCSDTLSNITTGVNMILTTIVIIAFLALIGHRYSDIEDIIEIKSTQQLIESNLEKGLDPDTNLISKIEHINEELLTNKYWNSMWYFDSLVDDELAAMNYIKIKRQKNDN